MRRHPIEPFFYGLDDAERARLRAVRAEKRARGECDEPGCNEQGTCNFFCARHGGTYACTGVCDHWRCKGRLALGLGPVD